MGYCRRESSRRDMDDLMKSFLCVSKLNIVIAEEGHRATLKVVDVIVS